MRLGFGLQAVTRAAFFACSLCFSSHATLAGDAATVEVLGFSADGGIFAFEEYGIQDGSGFPYANRFYIATATDSFLPGTPVRVRVEDESVTIDAVRAQARDRGHSIVSDAILAANRGFTAGMNPITELSADPFRLAVNPRPVFPPVDAPLEFRLEQTHVGLPERCRDLGDVVGFRLVRVATAAGSETRLIHEDTGIPQSRGCPIGYALAGIQTFYPQAGEPVFAVLIAVRTFGFEGPDHRFIAVTGPIGD